MKEIIESRRFVEAAGGAPRQGFSKIVVHFRRSKVHIDGGPDASPGPLSIKGSPFRPPFRVRWF
jgi:hypothetical protein